MFEDVRVAVPAFYAHITDVQNSRILKVHYEQLLWANIDEVIDF